MSRPKMLNADRCFLHSGKHDADKQGFFENEGIGPVWCRVRLFYCGEEYNAKIKRNTVHVQQQGLDLRNRYFAISHTGTVHVCSCRYSKEVLAYAKREADQMLRSWRTDDNQPSCEPHSTSTKETP